MHRDNLLCSGMNILENEKSNFLESKTCFSRMAMEYPLETMVSVSFDVIEKRCLKSLELLGFGKMTRYALFPFPRELVSSRLPRGDKESPGAAR